MNRKALIISIVTIVLALAGVFLFRHNGVVPFLFTAISIFYLSYKFKCIKYLLAIVVSLLITTFLEAIK